MIEAVSAQNLTVVQWAGLGLLTLALVILMLTRWGQARPLSKCIALSVFAHILFMTYAYGTKLIFDYPEEQPETYIRLSVLPEEQLDSNHAESAAWNEFSSEAPALPSLQAPDRQTLDVAEPDLEAEQAPVQMPAIEPTPAELPLPEPPRPEPEPPAPQPPTSVAGPTPEIEQVELPVPELAPPPVPETTSLARQEVPTQDELARPADLVDEIQPPSSEQIQQLADMLPSDRPGDAFLGDEDLPRASDNRVETINRAASDTHRRELNAAPPQAQEVPRRADGTPVPEVYSLRARSSRTPVLQRYGGTPQTEDSVAAALRWLAANQNADGRWDADVFGAGQETRALGHDRRAAGADADTGITGLALLALLGSGHTHLDGLYRGNVQKALEYLIREQQSDGNLAGRASLFARMYCHGIASLAISEAYALTGDQQLEPYVRRAIDYTLRAQHPTTGGWRYQPGDRGDMSQFGWQVMALKSAELAGLPIPAETRAGMVRFLADVSSGREGGLASYRRGERASSVMTAEALACRFFLGRHRDRRQVGEATDFVSRELPGAGSANLYYWYYGTLALFQVQGRAWDEWNRALQDALLRRQRVSGPLAGSWDPDTVWGGYGGRVYSTAMATLCLEVYYRYLPVYEQGR